MAPILGQKQQHHQHQTHLHSATKASHKPFKLRHASKNALRDRAKGKIEFNNQSSHRKTRHQQVLSKLDRRNRAKQKRLASRHAHLDAASVFAGKDGAPRIVAVVPLSDGVDKSQVVKCLGASVDAQMDEQTISGLSGRTGMGQSVRVEFERFKQKLQFVVAEKEMIPAMDTCRLADFVLLVLRSGDALDEYTQELLKVVESQGVSSVLVAVQGLDMVETKKRPQALTASKHSISRFFPDHGKIYSLDSWQDCLNAVRSLCSTTPKGIRWREDRSWMLVEDLQWPDKMMAADRDVGQVAVTGIVRGKGLHADRLVQLGDMGDFQIEKIVAAPLPTKRKCRTGSMAVDETSLGVILDLPTEDQDDMLEIAPEEVLMGDVDDVSVSMAPSQRNGVLLDDHRYFSDEDSHIVKPRRLPKGTSKYQAAWFLGDESDSGSDMEEEETTMQDAGTDVKGEDTYEPMYDDEDIIVDAPATEAGNSEYPQSEMFLDPSPAEEAEAIEAHRAQRLEEAEEDARFPDEIELESNVLARERLARYRGLKNARTSVWDTEEDRAHEPAEWRRLLEIRDYKSARNKVLNETITNTSGITPGTRVQIYLRGVPLSLQDTYDKSRPLGLFSLLRHEHKHTAVNYSITLSSSVQEPIKSKSELIVQCGPRRLVINPLFSVAGSTPNDVHKLIRFLHPSQSAVASFVGPLTWGAVPILYFARTPSSSAAISSSTSNSNTTSTSTPLQLIGTGTALAPSTNRITAKRIVLTGHPYKIHKRLVTVRYMFFNAEDVNWFRALRLWTRRGRSGYVKESLGTHGYFKATFDGKLSPMDAVAVTLWKRVWPRVARRWECAEEERRALAPRADEIAGEGVVEMEM